MELLQRTYKLTIFSVPVLLTQSDVSKWLKWVCHGENGRTAWPETFCIGADLSQ